MNNIRKRIDKVEKRLEIGQHENACLGKVIIILPAVKEPTQEDLGILGPENSWIAGISHITLYILAQLRR